MNLHDLTDRLRAALAVHPAGAGAFKFVIRGEGVIRAQGGEVDNADTPADCTLTMAPTDFRAVLAGELDPTAALMDGRMELNGDVGVAAAIQPALVAAWVSPEK